MIEGYANALQEAALKARLMVLVALLFGSTQLAPMTRSAPVDSCHPPQDRPDVEAAPGHLRRAVAGISFLGTWGLDAIGAGAKDLAHSRNGWACFQGLLGLLAGLSGSHLQELTRLEAQKIRKSRSV